MVFVQEIKPNLWYVYKSVRLPDHKHPVKIYLGPADTYAGGMKMVRQKLAALQEKAEQKAHSDEGLAYIEEKEDET